jgi:hypothetical protein
MRLSLLQLRQHKASRHSCACHFKQLIQQPSRHAARLTARPAVAVAKPSNLPGIGLVVSRWAVLKALLLCINLGIWQWRWLQLCFASNALARVCCWQRRLLQHRLLPLRPDSSTAAKSQALPAASRQHPPSATAGTSPPACCLHQSTLTCP